jgi:hypothetical protein
MVDKKSKKNNSISQSNPLLIAYSVNEIIQVLNEIDLKIVALHRCSSEDFLTLNDNFKNYYRESKTISGNASIVFEIVSGNTNEEFHSNLTTFNSRFCDLTANFESFIQQNGKLIDELFSQLNLLFVPLNNYRQNISTLKYLAANLTLNARYEEEQKSEILKKDSNEMVELIENLKTRLHQFDLMLTHTRKNNSDILGRLAELRFTTLENISLISERISSSINLLSKKHQEAVKKIPVLTKKTENSSAGIAKIITSLQYHDIIRQKIEHIQTTQKEILRELQQLDSKGSEQTKLHIQAKTFMKIRDIAGLQAAQLLHANKEYQMAIENITNRFIEIGDNTATISTLCLELSIYSEGSESTLFDEIRKNLEDANKLAINFSHGSKQFEKYLRVFYTEFTKVVGSFNEIQKLNKKLDGLIDKTIFDAHNNDKTEIPTILQIKNLLTDIRSSISQATETIVYCSNMEAKLKVHMDRFSEGSAFPEELSEFSSKLPVIITTINNNNEKLHTLVHEISKLSDQVIRSIKTSIQNVKYYDYFEKMIDEIINELNTINIRLQSGEDIDPDMKQENLKYLKEKYTMESEHVIHNQIAASEVGVNILQKNAGPEPEIRDENDENLELF